MLKILPIRAPILLLSHHKSSPRHREFKAILFDLDGTLVEFKFKVKESRLAMIDLLAKKGFDQSGWNESSRTQEIIDQAEEQWKSSETLKKEGNDFEKIRGEIFRLLDNYEFDALSQARPHPGSIHILSRIKNAQLLSGIVTNSGRAPVDSVLSELGFEPYISVLITRNEMEKLKPNPSGLVIAMNRLGVGPKHSLYVGDSVIDIEAARRAKVKCAAVSTGIYQEEALKKMSPDYLIKSLEELEGIVL